jgi:plasmid maintenance system killer protein
MPGTSILKDLANSDQDVKALFYGSLEKIHAMKSLEELSRGGFRWEKLEGRFLPGTKKALYSYRLNRNWRVVCLLHPGPVIEILWVADHDKAY